MILRSAAWRNKTLTVGRHRYRRAISAAGHQAVFLTRNVNQFHQEEIAGDAYDRQDDQARQDDNIRQRLVAAVVFRFAWSE